jgi:hypothetical protein
MPLAVFAWWLWALWNVSPADILSDARSFAHLTGATLIRPPMYVVIAPLSDVLDALSLLSSSQLIALTVTLVLYYSLWRFRRARRRGTTGWCEFCAGLRAFLIYVLLVLLAAVMPRPMAALRMSEPDAVVFDVHSHTNFSHDARSTFTVEQNREWHRSAGFDVAYITDHRCFDGAAEGLRSNPKRAGEGTVLLSGVELQGGEQHQVVLEPPDAVVAKGFLEDWCLRASAGRVPAILPVRIQTIPEDISQTVVATPATPNGVTAIEIFDGAPRGLAQADREDKQLWDLAGANHLTVVSGSNNHGWGRTAVAWNVARIPGWRSMSPDSLGRAIEARLRSRDVNAVQVIKRNRFESVSNPYAAIGAYAFMPLIFAVMALPKSIAETLAWVAWLGVIALVVRVVRRRRGA